MSSGKVMSLDAAVAAFVSHGAHISIGGFTINRTPMAAVYEIIRQGIRNLHLYAHSNGQGVDELIGGSCVARLEIAYGGSGRFAPTCIRFRSAVERGRITVEDYSNYQMTLRFMAGAMGVPFLPTRSALGSSIADQWGFAADTRRADPQLPDRKLVIMENPFGTWAQMPKVALVPAINPDVTIIHAQMADAHGTVRIQGLTFADVEQAKAARRVIVTCEELVDEARLREEPDRNQLAPFCVDAVVPVPYGAYPTACFRRYDYDPIFLIRYARSARDDRLHADYLRQFIMEPADHAAFMALQAPQQLAAIQADPRSGYAVGLDRVAKGLQ